MTLSMRSRSSDDSSTRIAFLGNYLPRLCGIATFTTDLCEAVSVAAPDLSCFAIAMNDTAVGYDYPDRVRFEIPAERREQYDLASDFLNVNKVGALCVQHEYGIFGGQDGRYLLPLVRQVQAPIVTTLHTIVTEPSASQMEVLRELTDISDVIVVMSPRAATYLQDIYRVPGSKVRMIHHGIPDLPFVDPNYYKDQFAAEGHRLLLTFGLLSEGKGIEYVIEALPRIVAQAPDVLYLVLGATHPAVKRERGEAYRVSLQRRVHELGLQRHVLFHNRFVELSELSEYLGAADIYLTPYLDPAQIVSGTLAYALGAGKAVVSTPYWYAEDMLAEGRGRIVPFRDPDSLAEAVLDLLNHETQRHAMRKKAYTYCRNMIWKEVAREYLDLFREISAARHKLPRKLSPSALTKERFDSLPELKPDHLVRMTDSVGILQHSLFTVPNRHHGYSADDQARALMVAVLAEEIWPGSADWAGLASRYLSFLHYAFDARSSRFLNFMNYERKWKGPRPTEDVHSRSILALAHVVAYSRHPGQRALAMQLLDEAIPPTTSFVSPRSRAMTVLGVQLYLRRYAGASDFRRERDELAHLLYELASSQSTEGWPWLEDRLTYANAVIPHALIEAGEAMDHAGMFQTGLSMLAWLDEIQTADEGHFVPVGTEGWYVRGGHRARFDQQPIEAYTMIEACAAAYRSTRDERWRTSARKAFHWFLGRNDLGHPLYDYRTGGCRDGLHSDRTNENQGAESTIVWLLSLIRMHQLWDSMSGTGTRIQMDEDAP
jgi:glycosyltransferase involved in cell wall biosynthesis